MVRALVLALALAGATGSDCPTETKVKSSASGEAQNVQLISELPTDALVQWVDQSGHESGNPVEREAASGNPGNTARSTVQFFGCRSKK